MSLPRSFHLGHIDVPPQRRTVTRGQAVALDGCPGYDINNRTREFFGEWVVDHVNRCEVGLVPKVPDRYASLEDQTVFVDFPLPPAHQFWISGVDDHPTRDNADL